MKESVNLTDDNTKKTMTAVKQVISDIRTIIDDAQQEAVQMRILEENNSRKLHKTLNTNKQNTKQAMMKSILMKSKELRKYSTSKHTNTVINPAAFARQAIFFMLMMFMSVGSAWGQTFEPAALPTSNVYEDVAVADGTICKIHLNDHATQIMQDLSYNLKYARWFIADAENNNVDCSASGWSFAPYDNNGWTTGIKEGKYGYVYWNKSYTQVGDYSGLRDVLNMQITAPSESDWSGKKIIAVFSDETNASPTEPTLKTMYVFDVKTPDELTFTRGTEPATEIQIDVANTASPLLLDLWSTKSNEIISTLGNNLYHFYCRWYLRNTSTHEVVDFVSTPFSYLSEYNGKSSYYSYLANQGLIWNSELITTDGNGLSWSSGYQVDDVRQLALGGVTWSSPNANYEVVCVMSANAPTMKNATEIWKEPTFQLKYVFHMEAPDNFESELKVGGRKGVYLKDYVETETTSAEVEFTRALELVGSGTPKYARFILMKGGKAVDPAGKLTITGVSPAPQQTSKPTQGYYLYNSGNDLDLSGLSVTVNGADYADYRVVCIFSTDAAAAATGNVVETEPQWNVQYTYSFTKVTTLPSDQLANPYIQLNIHQMVLDYFGKTEDEMKDVWHADWSVRDKKTRAIQTLQKGNTQSADVWSAYVGYWWADYQNGNDYGATLNQNYIYAGHLTAADNNKDKLEAVQNMLGYLQIYAPSAYATIQGASDYEIVYQVTDDYHGGMPTMTSRFVFRIPSFENEPNTGMVEDVKPQTVPDRSQTSFTLGDMPSDAKYARFYLVDKNNNVIEPGTVLSVSGGTACGKTTSGIYLYNNGNIISPTVTIAVPNAYKTYKVVGLFSTTMTDPLLNGSTLIQEPKWDLQRTYTFDYTITTNEVDKTIKWDAAALAVDASAETDLDTDWNTSIDEMTTGQCIKWYVVDGSNVKQPLALGSARIGESWAIGLPNTFTVTDNVASQSNFTSIEASQLATWVTTNVYAPNGVTYADVSNCKIICEIYTNNEGTGNPNARYTFSIHKGFLGSLKNGLTETTERVLLPTADATTHTITVPVYTGTRYTRFYLTDANGNGTPVDPTGKLSAPDADAVLSTVEDYDVSLGYYRYVVAGPLDFEASQSLTLTLDAADLDQYNIVVVTSMDAAVTDGDNHVTSEPDWDSKTTYWFKYPVAAKSVEANVEWSAGSMQIVAPDIESTDNLGADYLQNNSSHYTMQWYVIDDDGIQNLMAGNSRVNDYWTIHVNGDPFTITGNTASVTNNANLSTNWNNWAAPVFFAPKNKTFRELNEKHTRFVCRFFEDDQSPVDETNLLSFTYTVYINHEVQPGELKDGGKRGGETLTPTASPMSVPLNDAVTAFAAEVGGTPRYARVYLTKSDGTLIDPTTVTEQLTVPGSTGFTTKEYGYYLYNESGLTLPDAQLTLPANKFNFYHVVIALSADAGESGHTGAFAPRRAPVVAGVYEPDYDYIYTIKFGESSTFPGTLTTDYFQHAKEILLSDESVTEVTIPLAENINKIKKEFGASSLVELANNFHVRWYLTKRDDSGDYEKIPNSENYLTAVGGDYWKHKKEEDFGLYWNSATSQKPGNENDAANILNIKVTKPSASDSWEDYRLMIVMSNDLTGQTIENIPDGYGGVAGQKLTHEPDDLNMLYIYNFFVEHDFQFVHDVGESGRPYVTRNGADIDTKDARINATVQQYSWDNSTGTKVAVSEDIRQGVHTVEYDVYVDPNSTTPVNLKLPFQYYYGAGNNLEPTAYIRWYDWTTDINHTRLIKEGTYLEDMQEVNNGSTVSRGYFMLNNSVGGIKPTQNLVGVTFNPNGLNELVTIACDVSKYYDGIYEGSANDTRDGFSGKKRPYLMHEPTLSTRYIFNIRPASVIATSIQMGEEKLAAGGPDMFQLAEDNGRISVAMKGTGTSFSIRASLSELDYYYINNGSSVMSCDKIAWYAYLEDETGIYRNDTQLEFNGTTETQRISRFLVSALNGTYTSISGSGSKSVTAQAGQRFHLVGYVGNNTRMAPVVHYEVNLIEAPAYPVSELPLERTEAYLRQHMTLQATVDFDGMCGTELSSTIASQSDNHSTEPLPWYEGQYGFCYPDVRRIWAGGGNDFMGISPLHGEYMLLRSMNGSGIPSSGYEYHWWDGTELYDYTYNYGLGLDGRGAAGQYGSFLYVDASDESRTIAKMNFEADLCAGSELCFTGVIANMTSGEVHPQVMSTVYAVKNDGTKVRVVSFHSASLSTTAVGYSKGVWYQVYGRIAIPSSVDLTNVDHYEVDIDNYARGTEGADYAVDQLQFYTSNAKLKVRQQDVNCGEESVKMNIYIDAEAVKSNLGQNIYWRICDENGNALTDASLYDNDSKLYGVTPIPNTVPTTIPTEATFGATTPNSGYFIGTDGITYFSLASRGFDLEQGVEYYVSVYNMGEIGEPNDEALWAKNTDACAIYSPIFVPKMMYLTMENGEHESVTTVSGSCSDQTATVNLNVVLNMPDDDEISGFKAYDGVHFDYFLGTLAEFNTYSLTGDNTVLLSDALKHYRGKEGSGGPDTYKTETTVHADYISAYPNYAAVIQQAIDEGKLFLSASSSFNHTIKGDADSKAYIAALPIEDVVNNGTSDFHICSPLEFIFKVDASGNAPTLVLGFEDVTGYPEAVRVVRVGKEQLNNMQNGDFVLHIPVHTFKVNDAATAKAGTLTIQGDLDLLKYQGGTDQTTDSRVTADVDKIATFESTTINSSNMYIAVNFHGTDVTKPTFHEGFAYRMFFQVKDAGDPTACEGNVEFLLKVVPEFVTWTGGSNTNWNNDANWKRSTRTELYKGVKGTATNTASAAHTEGYENNGEGTLNTISTTPATYVPMKFTYVTIPAGLRAPNLSNLTYDATTKVYGSMGTGATANIQYDLMVRYTEKTCVDHSTAGNIYDCEKFYGNWAKELYLKPAAELLNQQWLTYEKVWVEKELQSNTWTLMSTPLQNTYAGDMYVPVTDDATTNGRQISEAFQPINFSTTANAAGFKYSRTLYPIYQKGWTQEGVFVYTKTNDIRAEKYSANIPGGVSTVLNQWSHVYNDVQVPYSTWTAFAVRPHKKSQSALTLIRLPKADASYDYYQWDNTSPADGKLTHTVGKATTGKLLTDGTPNIDGVTHGVVYGTTARTAGSGTYSAQVSDIQSSPSDYQLVGNPYLCTIDMATFLSENAANLESGTGYWTYTNNNTGSPMISGTIAPMQSFFVKVKSNATNVVFTPAMMRDGNSITPSPAPALLLTAQNEAGRSSASVWTEDGDDVETLFDSNLADVPMVYTVSEGKAVTINHTSSLQEVCFGVTCNSDEMVDVTFDGVTDDLYVFDALTGESTEVGEDGTVTIQANDYGRYYLTSSTSIGDRVSESTDGIIVSVRGNQVTVTATDNLVQVRAVSVSGASVYQAADCGTNCQFQLQQGSYIIEAESTSAHKTIKVFVR